MPVFFAAAGWAAAGPKYPGTDRPSVSTVRRVRGLVGTAFVVVTLWGIVGIAEQLVRGRRGILTDGARLATQPLWFLAAYVPLVLLAPDLVAPVRRQWLIVIGCSLLVGAGDAMRFVNGAPRWVGFPGFFAVWCVPFVIGWWWRSDNRMRQGRERRGGIVLFFLGTVLCVALVHWFGYSARLIDMAPGGRSNSTPPTLFTVAACISQCGVFMVVALGLDGVSARFTRGVKRVGAVAPGVYAWHLTALSLCAVPLQLGLPTPERLTAAWWLTRPVWFGAVLAVTWVLVKSSQRVVSRRHIAQESRVPRMRVLLPASVFVAAGAGIVGLLGPTTPPRAFSASIALGVAWCLLRGEPSPPAERRDDQFG